MRENHKKIEELSLVYDLSLAVGLSLDPRENCLSFLSALKERIGLYLTAVWVKGWLVNESTEELVFFEGVPGGAVANPILLEEIREFEAQGTANEAMVRQDGRLAFLPLQDYGLLVLCCRGGGVQPFSVRDVESLHPVIEKFALSLRGAFAHHLLVQAERQISSSEQKLRQIINTSLDAAILVDGEGRVQEWSDRARQIYGYEPGEVLGKMLFEFITPPEDHEEQRMLWNDFITTGRLVYEEYQPMEAVGYNKWGRRFPVEWSFSLIRVDGTQQFCLFFRDVSDRKQAQSELVNARTRLAALIANIQAGILVEDENRKIVLVNNHFCKIFGITVPPEVLEGEDCSQAVHAYKHLFLEPGEFAARIEQVLEKKEITLGDLLMMKDGRILERDYIPVESAGNYLGHMWQYRDITERKQFENELLRAKQAAEEAKLAERQFLTNMSHEIRTPMNAVIGMTHLLSETDLSSTQRDYLDALRFSADNLLGIINNVLDLSKIEAGELQFEQHNFHLMDLLRSLQQSFQYKVKDKPISVVLDMDHRIENEVVGDSTRLTQILTNLLGNASKFTHRGTIGLGARLLSEQDDQYLIEFTVFDTGIGIEEDKIGLIFENFKQADKDVTRKYGGTGLGLSIVRQLVEHQGGTIEVESEVGNGTTFRLTLPFGDSHKKALAVSKGHDPSAVEIAEPNLNGIDILVVEDNYLNQKLIQKILDLWNISYEMATNGQEALEKASTRPFDLILMDLHMPEIDGVEAARMIRNYPANPNYRTPIIGITAAALLDEKNRVFEAGMNDFLTKPFSPKVLKSLIHKWLGEKKSSGGQVGAIAGKIKLASLEERFKYLYDFSGGDEIFIREMIRTFIEEMPPALNQLDAAVNDRDLSRIYHIIHRLKPNYLMMGLEKQQMLATTLEQMAKAGEHDFEKIEDLVQTLRADTLEAFPELVNYKF